MQDIVEYERRITAALNRIGAGIGAVTAQAASKAVAARAAEEDDSAESGDEALRDGPILARVRASLNRAREREAQLVAEYEAELASLRAQLDVQGLEAARLRRVALTIEGELARLREAATAGLVDASLINRAMLAELDALRATRLAEIAELEEITAALDAHIQEAADA